MNDDVFARLVAEDVKNKVSHAQRKILRQPQNHDRWKRALLALLRNVDEQINDIKHDMNDDYGRYEALGSDGKALLEHARNDYEARLKKIERFAFHISKRLDEVAIMIEEDDQGGSIDLDADILASAIRKHKAMMTEMDMEATPIDKALWSVLENEWLFDSISQDELASYQ